MGALEHPHRQRGDDELIISSLEIIEITTYVIPPVLRRGPDAPRPPHLVHLIAHLRRHLPRRRRVAQGHQPQDLAVQLRGQVAPPCARDRPMPGASRPSQMQCNCRRPRCSASPTRGSLRLALDACLVFLPPAIAIPSADTPPAHRHGCPGTCPAQPVQARRPRSRCRRCPAQQQHVHSRVLHSASSAPEQRSAGAEKVSSDQAGSGSLRSRHCDRWLRLASDDSRDVRHDGPRARCRRTGRASASVSPIASMHSTIVHGHAQAADCTTCVLACLQSEPGRWAGRSAQPPSACPLTSFLVLQIPLRSSQQLPSRCESTPHDPRDPPPPVVSPFKHIARRAIHTRDARAAPWERP